jgi:hypothetical protein
MTPLCALQMHAAFTLARLATAFPGAGLRR